MPDALDVSIITIVMNDPGGLRRAIKSVADQVASQKNIRVEHIVVDDGSTDDTDHVAHEFARCLAHVRCVALDANVGRAAARNRGLATAAGKYLCFLDADDELPSGAIAALVNEAERTDADVTFGRLQAVDGATGKAMPRHYTDEFVSAEQHGITLEHYPRLVENHSIIGRLYRREFIDAFRIGFNDSRRNAEDITFAFYTAYYARRISLINTYVYRYFVGNYLGAANWSKVCDARDNFHDTLNFSIARGDTAVAHAMRHKAARFCIQLERAEKVAGFDDPTLVDYIGSLVPIARAARDDDLGSNDREYLHLVSAGMPEKALALRRWMRGAVRELAEFDTKSSELSQHQRVVAEQIDELYRSPSWAQRRRFSGRLRARVRRRFTRRRPVPSVSVVIPVYNTERYLSTCLDSVCGQSLENIEIVCVDDGSTDLSAQLVNAFAKRDARVHLVSHAENRGLPAARNTGLDRASGEFVYFLDSDDLLAFSGALRALYELASSDASDETVGGLSKWVPELDVSYMEWHSRYSMQLRRGENIDRFPALRANVVAVNKLISTEFLRRHDIRFDESLRKFEDNPFSCAVHAAATRVSVLPVTTYLYRQRATESIMAQYAATDVDYELSAVESTLRTIIDSARSVEVKDSYREACSLQIVQCLVKYRGIGPSEAQRSAVMNDVMALAPLLRLRDGTLPERIAGVIEAGDVNGLAAAWKMAYRVAPVAGHPAMRYAPFRSAAVREKIAQLRQSSRECASLENDLLRLISTHCAALMHVSEITTTYPKLD